MVAYPLKMIPCAEVACDDQLVLEAITTLDQIVQMCVAEFVNLYSKSRGCNRFGSNQGKLLEFREKEKKKRERDA